MAWTLRQEHGEGWFDHNCLNDNDAPLLHTMAYTSRGLLECGVILSDQSYIDAASRTADCLVSRLRKNGSIAGRFNRKWQASATWSCLTGVAQMSLVWQRLYEVTGNEEYIEAARKANVFLRGRQDTTNRNPGIRGGIAGSYPITGDYGKYRFLNWAAKFYVDALMREGFPNAVSEACYPG